MDGGVTTRELSIRAIAAAAAGGASTTDPDEALAGALADLRGALRCQAGAVWLFDGQGLSLRALQNDVVPPSALAARRGRVVALDRQTVPGVVAVSMSRFVVDDVAKLAGEPAYDASFDRSHGFQARALLALPLVAAGALVGVVELQNPVGSGEVAAFTVAQLELATAVAGQLARVADLARALDRVEREQFESVCTLAAMVEFRDPDIRWHVRRISGYSEVLARSAGLDAAQVRLVRLASPLHDVGKVGIPPSILFKPGKLTDEEFLVTKEHTSIGHQVLRGTGLPLLDMAADIALSHHERFDGGGYPGQLHGTSIPLPGRIVAIADVFDALTTRRIYKPAIGLEQSLKILAQESTKHFDPELVDAFQRVFPQVLEVKQRFSPEG
jgi:HD-GYP domain-containing protein (c-di-GMP phosphodiesterase class II)